VSDGSGRGWLGVVTAWKADLSGWLLVAGHCTESRSELKTVNK